nr:guanine nucleotide-binding protein subunit beta-2-like [Tanacetum cinerariifolium]
AYVFMIYDPEYDIAGIVNLFLQIRLMCTLRILRHGDANASDFMNDVLSRYLVLVWLLILIDEPRIRESTDAFDAARNTTASIGKVHRSIYKKFLPKRSIVFSISGRLLFAGYSNGDCFVWDSLLAKLNVMILVNRLRQLQPLLALHKCGKLRYNANAIWDDLALGIMMRSMKRNAMMHAIYAMMRAFLNQVYDHDGGSCNAYINKPFEVEFSKGVLRCWEYVTLRKVDDASHKESFKRLKAVEVSGSHSTKDTPTHDLKVEALQLKITEAYRSFKDMLKGFDREDLDALWRLVKEKFSSAVPTVDKEKALWVELKRLFEPDADDVMWKLQRYMHYQIAWRLPSNYGVHQVSSTTRRHDMYMLTKKDNPLSNRVKTLILSTRLEVEEDIEKARDIVMKIFMKANQPPSRSLDISSK